MSSIDTLFGSKTRVELLRLFLSNPEQSFYVREITRIINEQINSVRRELANMLNMGIIESNVSDNRLYYKVNKKYKYYMSLSSMFTDSKMAISQPENYINNNWRESLGTVPGAKVVIISGSLCDGAISQIDILVAGNILSAKFKKVVHDIEEVVGHELAYSQLEYDDFLYRLSAKDKFVMQMLNGNHEILLDVSNVLGKYKEKER